MHSDSSYFDSPIVVPLTVISVVLFTSASYLALLPRLIEQYATMEKLDNKENISDLEHHDAARNESDKSSSTNGVAVPALKSEEEKKLVRKIDLYILPCMWMMYLWSYMDRTK